MMEERDKIELEVFKDLNWYTACEQTPWLVKGGVNFETNSYHILITNFKRSYFCHAPKEQIESERKEFNPSIQTDTFKQFLDILHKIINEHGINTDYTFTKLGAGEDFLKLKLSASLEFYPFNWEFLANKAPVKMQEYITKDLLLIPAFNLINILEKRYERLKTQFSAMRTDCLNRLNEAEKRKFKEYYKDDEIEWKNTIINTKLERVNFPQIKYTPALKFLSKESGLKIPAAKKKEEEKKIDKRVEKKRKRELEEEKNKEKGRYNAKRNKGEKEKEKGKGKEKEKEKERNLEEEAFEEEESEEEIRRKMELEKKLAEKNKKKPIKKKKKINFM